MIINSNEEVIRRIDNESLFGLEVAGYRYKVHIPVELQGSEFTYGYAGHWSTPVKYETAERLFTEQDVRNLVQSIYDNLKSWDI
jgi:hypothetical protein